MHGATGIVDNSVFTGIAHAVVIASVPFKPIVRSIWVLFYSIPFVDWIATSKITHDSDRSIYGYSQFGVLCLQFIDAIYFFQVVSKLAHGS
jgi:hypothetical protein